MVRFTTEKGKIIDDFESSDNENPKVFSKLYDKEKWVLVDIRSLRRRIRYDGSLTMDTYRLIEKYDFCISFIRDYAVKILYFTISYYTST